MPGIIMGHAPEIAPTDTKLFDDDQEMGIDRIDRQKEPKSNLGVGFSHSMKQENLHLPTVKYGAGVNGIGGNSPDGKRLEESTHHATHSVTKDRWQ